MPTYTDKSKSYRKLYTSISPIDLKSWIFSGLVGKRWWLQPLLVNVSCGLEKYLYYGDC
jgi:hypothetical protein